MTTEHKSGYAIMRAKVAKQAKEIADLQTDLTNTARLNKAHTEKQAQQIERLDAELKTTKAALAASEQAAKRNKKIIQELTDDAASWQKSAEEWKSTCLKSQESYKIIERRLNAEKEDAAELCARIDWLLSHAPIARMMYNKHFGL